MDHWLTYIFVAPFPASLLWAMLSDLRRFEIPNAIPILLVAAYLLASFVLDVDALVVLRQIGIAAAAVVVGFALFALGVVGGGDVKLVAAVLPWLAPLQIPQFLVIMALFGGLVGLVILGLRQLPPGTILLARPWLRRLRQEGKIPYGLAIGCAGLITFANIPLLSN